MRVLNRIAVGITAKQPYIDWTRKHDADATRGQLTVRVATTKPYGTAILLPEFEVEAGDHRRDPSGGAPSPQGARVACACLAGHVAAAGVRRSACGT